jgi:CRP-like cAMP-binding protein
MNRSALRVPSFEVACFGRNPKRAEIAAIAGNDLFANVERARGWDAAAAFRIAELPACTLLYERWHPASLAVLLLAGSIALYRRGNDDARIALGGVLPGGFCGEESFFPGAARLHASDARCDLPATVAWARARDLAGTLEGSPEVALNIARALHDRLGVLVEGLSG